MKSSLLLGVLLIGSLSLSNAQTYSIPRFTIAGGGGTLAGGPYLIQGTAGQPEPGEPRAGVPYVIMGGFWPGAVSTSPSTHPELTVELQPDGNILVSWPISASGFGLDEAPTLGALSNGAQWSAVPLPYLTNADRISVTVQPKGSKLYRLKSL